MKKKVEFLYQRKLLAQSDWDTAADYDFALKGPILRTNSSKMRNFRQEKLSKALELCILDDECWCYWLEWRENGGVLTEGPLHRRKFAESRKNMRTLAGPSNMYFTFEVRV